MTVYLVIYKESNGVEVIFASRAEAEHYKNEVDSKQGSDNLRIDAWAVSEYAPGGLRVKL